MKNYILLSLLAFLFIGCASDTGAIFVTERQTEPAEDEPITCPTFDELYTSKTCSEVSLERKRKISECQELGAEEEEEGLIQECYQEACIPELEAFLQEQHCQDDCFWQNNCTDCLTQIDPYGYQAYWMVIMEACVCSHEQGGQICSDNCDNQTFLPEEIEQECTNGFFSGEYEEDILSCYINDFAVQCGANLLCENFWTNYQECPI
jgi:hypothetical protein